jgi:phytoene dehydrogenase-like protein
MIDLLVIGGGLAGLSAAARAAQYGASVVVVEKGPSLGGSAVLRRLPVRGRHARVVASGAHGLPG